jgi:hypothetical protein
VVASGSGSGSGIPALAQDDDEVDGAYSFFDHNGDITGPMGMMGPGSGEGDAGSGGAAEELAGSYPDEDAATGSVSGSGTSGSYVEEEVGSIDLGIDEDIATGSADTATTLIAARPVMSLRKPTDLMAPKMASLVELSKTRARAFAAMNGEQLTADMMSVTADRHQVSHIALMGGVICCAGIAILSVLSKQRKRKNYVVIGKP